jgi:hypothetical protein
VDVVIAANVLIASRQSHGVSTLLNNSKLINNGNIVAGDFEATHYGVSFLGTGTGAITNNQGASVTAHSGIIVDNGAYSIVNHGTISGLAGAGVLLASDGGDVLTNDGGIFGHRGGWRRRKHHGRRFDPKFRTDPFRPIRHPDSEYRIDHHRAKFRRGHYSR